MIGERLRNLRKWRALTQVQLAQASGLAQNYISALERGTAQNPSQDAVRRLALALRVPETELAAPLFAPPASAPIALASPAEEGASDVLVSPTEAPGHQYKGYRVMAARPEGGSYCAYVTVEVDGAPLPLHYFESRGIEWGFLGAGPQALAYDLLVHEYGRTLARNYLSAFTEAVVAHFPSYVSSTPGAHLEWTLTGAAIREWLLQQPRPARIRVYIPPDSWEAQVAGPPRSTVVARFLPLRRLILDLALVDTPPHRQVLTAKEQELRADPAPWLVWHDVRDVMPEEYWVFNE